MPDSASHSHPQTPRKGRRRVQDSAPTALVELLGLVRRTGGVTRQELERETALGRAAVSDRLALLTELGLIDESALGAATGGRAPRLVRLASTSGRLLAAVLNPTTLSVGIADPSGQLLNEHHEEFHAAAGPEALLDRLVELFGWLCERQGPVPAWGVLLAVPGVVKAAEGTFLSRTPDTVPEWRGPLVEELTRRLGIPVWMRSKVEAMTVGEASGGAGIGAQSMLFVRLDRSVSAGIFADGYLWRGAGGAAGMIGAVQVNDGGQTGTLDDFAGSDALRRLGRRAGESGASERLADVMRRRGDVSVVDVAQAAQAGDSAAIRIMAQAGRLVGQVVATLANVLNPELVVLSGHSVETSDAMLAAIREAIYGGSQALVSLDLKIVRSQMGTSAGLVGATRTLSELIFHPPFLKNWVLDGTPLRHPDFTALRNADEHAAPVTGDTAAIVRLA